MQKKLMLYQVLALSLMGSLGALEDSSGNTPSSPDEIISITKQQSLADAGGNLSKEFKDSQNTLKQKECPLGFTVKDLTEKQLEQYTIYTQKQSQPNLDFSDIANDIKSLDITKQQTTNQFFVPVDDKDEEVPEDLTKTVLRTKTKQLTYYLDKVEQVNKKEESTTTYSQKLESPKNNVKEDSE